MWRGRAQFVEVCLKQTGICVALLRLKEDIGCGLFVRFRSVGERNIVDFMLHES